MKAEIIKPKYEYHYKETTIIEDVVYNSSREGGTTALRPIGQFLESADDVFKNPNLLRGQSPEVNLHYKFVELWKMQVGELKH